jgi:hypothetical protein
VNVKTLEVVFEQDRVPVNRGDLSEIEHVTVRLDESLICNLDFVVRLWGGVNLSIKVVRELT